MLGLERRRAVGRRHHGRSTPTRVRSWSGGRSGDRGWAWTDLCAAGRRERRLLGFRLCRPGEDEDLRPVVQRHPRPDSDESAGRAARGRGAARMRDAVGWDRGVLGLERGRSVGGRNPREPLSPSAGLRLERCRSAHGGRLALLRIAPGGHCRMLGEGEGRRAQRVAPSDRRRPRHGGYRLGKFPDLWAHRVRASALLGREYQGRLVVLRALLAGGSGQLTFCGAALGRVPPRLRSGESRHDPVHGNDRRPDREQFRSAWQWDVLIFDRPVRGLRNSGRARRVRRLVAHLRSRCVPRHHVLGKQREGTARRWDELVLCDPCPSRRPPRNALT